MLLSILQILSSAPSGLSLLAQLGILTGMPILRSVTPEPFSPEMISRYSAIRPSDFEEIRSFLPILSGKRILHISSSANGGGVAELLLSRCAFERGIGIESSWVVIEDVKSFFVITKKIHNGLQGESIGLSPEEQEEYFSIASALEKRLVEILDESRPDIIVIHDPQPLPCIAIARRFAPTIVRLHIDLSAPYAPTIDFLRPLIDQASSVIISSDTYRSALAGYPEERIAIIPPAIDPFTEKNSPIDPVRAARILGQHGIDTRRPFLSQVSRFDPWKDPLGAIAVYRNIKRSVPDIQLVLTGFIEASDDPEASAWIRKTEEAAMQDPDIFLFSDLSELQDGISDSLFINAINTLANCTLQMSRREGFGLTITEAMWKERVVVARPSQGALLQIVSGKNGFLGKTPEDMMVPILRILSEQGTARMIGNEAGLSVRKRFLLPRSISLNCKTYRDALQER